MSRIFLSLIIYATLILATFTLGLKVNNFSNKINLFCLAFFALVAMFAFDRISDPNIKILYSLCLVIASGVGRYGTQMIEKKSNRLHGDEYANIRQLIYVVVFIFGLLGLIA
ncbi:hypothetical protein HY383_03075 [Candidatus Daviesbacteria bacterium]|nr:hypothetical protein [Candidatus Daviesbacteria bacterium]